MDPLESKVRVYEKDANHNGELMHGRAVQKFDQ